MLGLFEGVVTGAADGYARIAGKPAAVLLHLGPGLGNGLANLHNARRARTPMVCIVGAHATGHVRYDAPLQSDIEAVARTVSGWVHASGTSRDVADDAMRALEAAQPGQIATLVLPADVSWSDGGGSRPTPDLFPPGRRWPMPPSGVAAAATAAARQDAAPPRRSGPERGRPAGGEPDRGATGARLLVETFPGPDGAGRRAAGRRTAGLPGRAGRAQLSRLDHLVLAGARLAGVLLRLSGPGQRPGAGGLRGHRACRPDQDVDAALERLADQVAAGAEPVLAVRRTDIGAPPATVDVNAISLANTIAASLPEDAIISDEANTSGFALPAALATAPRHTLLTLTGGAIGQGLPVATGAAIAAPDRPVLSLEADGSALYTIQALWTQAREQLNVTTVMFNNAAYAILRLELVRTGAGQAGSAPRGCWICPTPPWISSRSAPGWACRRNGSPRPTVSPSAAPGLRRTRTAPDRGHRPPSGPLEIYGAGLRGVLPAFPMAFAELEARAEQALPPSVLSYVAGGAGSEHTQRANVSAFQQWGLIPRMFVGATRRDLSVELFGMRLPSPLLMAPIGVIGPADSPACSALVAGVARLPGAAWRARPSLTRLLAARGGTMGKLLRLDLSSNACRLISLSSPWCCSDRAWCALTGVPSFSRAPVNSSLSISDQACEMPRISAECLCPLLI